GTRASVDFWRVRLARTSHTKAHTVRYRFEGNLHCVSANSSRLDKVMGRNWLAVGDAAAAFDPLSSQGIYHALDTALRSAEAIATSLSGNDALLNQYALFVEKTFVDYLQLRGKYYSLEKRWCDSSFWFRRQ